jgi:hypothetical protein
VSLELATAAPERVLIGGAGPSPGAAAEVAEEARELAYRRAAFQRLRLRYSDPTARLYENPDPGEPVACISDDEDIGAVARGAPVGDVRIVHDGEESLIVDATAAQAALLVISRLHDGGWRAQVDERPARLARVNGAMMAVGVPPGTHRVALRYAPWSFRVGAAVSLVALLAWLAVVLRPARDGSFDAERTHDRDVPVREPARTVV